MTDVAFQYYIQDHQLGEFLTAAPGLILSKSAFVLGGLISARMTDHFCYSICELYARRVREFFSFHLCKLELNLVIAG
jgi:hypothetical protein